MIVQTKIIGYLKIAVLLSIYTFGIDHFILGADCCNDTIPVPDSDCVKPQGALGCGGVALNDCPIDANCSTTANYYPQNTPDSVCESGLTENTLCDVWEDRGLCYTVMKCEQYDSGQNITCEPSLGATCETVRVFLAVADVCEPCG